jgi:predicted transcriptional regulator
MDFNLDFDTEFDFGITSVSSDQVEQNKMQTEKLEQVSASSEGVTQRLGEIENTLEYMKSVLETKNHEELEIKKQELYTAYAERMKQVEKLTIPLLLNLAKNSDTNPYIHWPNRKEIVEEQIQKILTVTRGE